MNDNKTSLFLKTKRLNVLMWGYAVPRIISLLVATPYSIVDQTFVANTSYLGGYGDATNTVVFPLTVVALALVVMISDSCYASVSLSLGSGQEENVRHNVSNFVVLCIAINLILTAICSLSQGPIITMFGGQVSEEIFVQSKEYFVQISIGTPLYVFGQALNFIIRSDGSPKLAMTSILAGAVVNIVLDPISISGFYWGTAGATLAIVLRQAFVAELAV